MCSLFIPGADGLAGLCPWSCPSGPVQTDIPAARRCRRQPPGRRSSSPGRRRAALRSLWRRLASSRRALAARVGRVGTRIGSTRRASASRVPAGPGPAHGYGPATGSRRRPLARRARAARVAGHVGEARATATRPRRSALRLESGPGWRAGHRDPRSWRCGARPRRVGSPATGRPGAPRPGPLGPRARRRRRSVRSARPVRQEIGDTGQLDQPGHRCRGRSDGERHAGFGAGPPGAEHAP